MKNNIETTAVHEVISKKLSMARERLSTLRKQQAEIDLQIEDHSRIILALERTEATLSVALDPPLGDNEVEDLMAQGMEREMKVAAE